MAKQYENRDDGWRISNEMWSAMEPLLPPPKSHPLGCHRHRLDNRLVLNMIFLVLRTGVPWNALNSTGICSCTPVYARFREWVDAGVFEEFWRRGLLEYDRLKGIDWDWLALDGAMTKAPLGGEKTGPNLTDRGKGGVKRSLLTEAHGMPIAIEIDGANRHDMKLVEQTLCQLMIERPAPRHEKPQHLCLDKGYDYDAIRVLVDQFGLMAHIKSRGQEHDEKCVAGARARRRVVERAHSWMNRFRRLLIRWEKKSSTYLAMVHFALGIICWRAAYQ